MEESKRDFLRLRKYFRLATLEEMNTIRGGRGLLTGSPNNISTLAVYRLLKACFGPPNGASSADDKVTWEYFLVGPNSYLTVSDWKLFSWSIGVRYDSPDSFKDQGNATPDAQLLLDEITSSLKGEPNLHFDYSQQIVLNLFQLYYSNGEYYITQYKEKRDELEEINQERGETERGRSIAESLNLSLEVPTLMWSAIVAFILSLEGFFNLLYEIYLRENLRNDKDLLRRIAGMSLTEKYLLASTFCTGFQKDLDRKSTAYARLHDLVRLRNNLVHSNLTEEMREYVVTEDNLEFATQKQIFSTTSFFDPRTLDLETAEKVRLSVDVVVLDVVSSMKSGEGSLFQKALKRPNMITGARGGLTETWDEDE